MTTLVRDHGPKILPVTAPVASAWGRLAGVRPVPTAEALIAATALVHDLTLVTRNVKGFDGTGVRVLDPFTTR